jgi:hypothetical protein
MCVFRHGYYGSAWLVVPVIVAPLAIFAFLSAAQNRPPARASLTGPVRRRFPLEISPDRVDLGSLRGGKSGRGLLRLTNKQDCTVVLERVEADCPCVRAKPVPNWIPPGGVADLLLSLDTASEPDFSGKLVIPVVGYLSGGEVAFQAQVTAEVDNSFDRQSD